MNGVGGLGSVKLPLELFSVGLSEGGALEVLLSPIFVLFLVVVGAVVAAWKWRTGKWKGADFEISEAEFGMGDQKLKFRPNDLDRTVAYKIWVELSTRKIGLPIDLEDDIISEVYDSWYNFFQVTRELIKDIPVSKVRNKSTQKVISLSIDILNNGLRPHLTKWQARFRRWYNYKLEAQPNKDLHPQDVQKKFPEFETLKDELFVINARLMRYREKMYELVING